MSKAHEKFGWIGRTPPELETAVRLMQHQIDDVAAEIVSLARGPMTAAAQAKLMELLLGFQCGAFSLMSVGYLLAHGPAVDGPEETP